KETAKKENIRIHDEIQDNLARITFDVLIKMGLLSEFVSEPRLTDFSTLPQKSQKETILKLLGQLVINNKLYEDRWDDSFYFINNQRFKDILIYSKVTKKKEKYIELLVKPEEDIGTWITT